MPCKCEEYNNVAVISPLGELSGEEIEQLRRKVDEMIDVRQIVDLVIDLEACPFIDSEGLETLLWARRRCEDLFGNMRLVGLDANIRKVLEMTRLEPRFDCRADLATALKTMR
jgi:anti-anti-sigma factor